MLSSRKKLGRARLWSCIIISGFWCVPMGSNDWVAYAAILGLIRAHKNLFIFSFFVKTSKILFLSIGRNSH